MGTVDQLPITPDEERLGKKRKFLLISFTIVLVVIAIFYGLYWWLIARFYEETDNAYVNGNIIPITAQVGGTVIAVKADDTQYVSTGQLLVELDPIDAFIAFEQAKANLAQTLRNTQQLFINNTGLQANLKNQQVSHEKAKQDLLRRNQAIGVGAVSKEELTHAEDSLKSADAALTQAQSALLANRALTENTNLPQHPNVLAAATRLRQAYIDYMRTSIRAPVSGEISKRTAQVGQRVAAGTQLMALVPLEQVWVDANFKEKQVRYMRIGQPATLTADLYGSSVVYHGTIMGFSAGTGSAFALLPAQNATGNWIKVVQRLPVRIQLDPKELKAHPLRIGLSMEVTIDLHNQSGKYINETAPIPVYETPIYENWGKEADAEINKVISENISKTANLNANDMSNKPASKKGTSR
ncbi:HlyD family efflux transporter periplasmic adaptor subunit [Legionella maceachernii]|uniref:Multidrug efflux system n=1 Tax=Legionella maceachernii TaxID=466 RepID=A0A0W0WAS9_9GAMM|nr:HlyD family efflux transporter periplasmic adaptor subunit [Legionella maceachernii]KTD29416.1 multidrug efflux system [Legionella maceachernii]SJZ95338.1 membrane fusion protein, multidrug efflux system [Legionella maceachernii]SUP03296.1 Inner membrane protein yibH [Legionella maceachernii]